MKTKILKPALLLLLLISGAGLSAQQLQLSADLKQLIGQSINKDYSIASAKIDVKQTEEQQKALLSAYLPKVELGGKYMFAYSGLNGNIGDITGFESLGQLQQFMQTPTFAALFPNLNALSTEVQKLQLLMQQQGISMPGITKDIDGSIYGQYFGLDASVKLLLYSGGQVPYTSKALNRKIEAQNAMTEKDEADVITDVIYCYDQLAVLNQSKKVLADSYQRLQAEKNLAQSALRNGMAISFDTLKIAVAQAGIDAKNAELQSKQSLLVSKLAQLTGQPAEQFSSLNPELQLLLYSENGTGITDRPEYRALQSASQASNYVLKASRSHYLPKVQAVVTGRYDYLFNGKANFNDPFTSSMELNHLGLGPSVIAGVGFKWDLFDRSNGISKTKQAELDVKKSEIALEQAEELLKLNQVKVINTYQSTTSQVNFKDKKRKAALQALDMAVKSYEEGVINITERLAAETDLQNAELEYLQALAEQRQAAVECYKSTGHLLFSNIK